jgi:soluble lytic murein transglycosylase-like protein
MALTAQQMMGNLRDVLSNLRNLIVKQQAQKGFVHPEKVTNPRIMDMWGEDVRGAAKQYGIRPALLANLIHAESGGNPKAVSPMGARGLTQIMPATERAEGLSVRTPRDQIYSGAKYLSKLLALAGGDERRAVAAYNAGPGRLKGDRWQRIPETVKYVKKVLP